MNSEKGYNMDGLANFPFMLSSIFGTADTVTFPMAI